MSDAWDRPDADDPARGRDAVTVDVPLTSADATTDDRPAVPPTDRPPPTDWRRLVRIALAGGVTLGVAVAAVRSVSDDDDADGPTPGTAGEVGPAITTPPTLRPLETLPPPDAEQRAGDAPTDTFAAPAPPDPVVAPTYPPAPDVVPSEIVEYDIAAAVDRHDDDIARRSDTHIELGYGGYVLDVSIVRDQERDRYGIRFESRGTVEEVIVDVATGTTYIEPGTPLEIRIPNGDITGDADTNDYFDRLLRGPLRSDTYDAVATRGRGVVTIDGVGDAREFITRIDGELAPEWQIYAFGPVSEFVPADRPEVLEYSVYVDEQGRIVQVDGVSMLDNVPQLVEHRMSVLDEPVSVELPRDAAPSETTAREAG